MASKSKFFRVATEGATTDGRKIERRWIEQMAKNFNRDTYGARVWLEHLRSVYPDSAFRAYGDVLAVEARQVDGGKLALFAQIEPLPELVAMNKAGQKLYTSIEVQPEFADTGEAYLVGLAVTDTPASLGTEMLSFAAQHPDANPLAKRKQDPNNLFTELVPFQLEMEADEPDATAASAKFTAAINAVLAKFKGKGKSDDERFAALLSAMDEMGTHTTETVGQLEQRLTKLNADHTELLGKFNALTQKLSTQDAKPGNHRPEATGTEGDIKADC